MLITRLKSEETITSLCSGKVFIINCHGCKEVGFPEEEANALQKKLAVNTTGLLFDLLGRTNSREAITAAGDCIGATLYDLLRRLYRHSGGNEDLFATDAVDFDGGAVDAALLRSRAAYMKALAQAGELPPLNSDALTALPGIGQSTAQVIHNVDERAGK